MLSLFKTRLLTLFRRDRMERDLHDELQYHLEKAIQQNIDRGMSLEEARRAALIGFGGVEQIKEASRDSRGTRLIEDLYRDIRYGARMMAKHRGLTVVIVVTLALGIGANTAIFSVLDALVERMLPVKAPQQLVVVRWSGPNGRSRGEFPYPVFEQFRDSNHSLSGIFALDHSRVSVTVDGNPELVWGDFASGNYFDVLGVTAAFGRAFDSEDDRAGNKPVVVISYPYWERRFSQDPSVIGSTVLLGKIPFTVIGVAPKGFFGLYSTGNSADIILPMSVHPQLTLADHNTFEVVGRLKPGVSREAAAADLNVIFARSLNQTADPFFSREAEEKGSSLRIALTPGQRGFTEDRDDLAQQTKVLFYVVLIVLLIASVNVAGLLLARAVSREKEMAVRLAVGSGRGRLIRQLMTEAVMLAALGGAVGLLAAKWFSGMLLGILAAGGEPIQLNMDLNLNVFGFAAALALVSGLLFGLAPALAGTRVELTRVLSESRRESAPKRNRLGKSLVVSQIALSMALLIGAGLLIRTLRQLSEVNPGFPSNRVLSMWAFPSLIGYSHENELRLYRDVLEKLNSTPGIQSASLTRYSLHRGSGPVGPGFFKTTGIGILEGREFSDADTESSAKVAVISEATARKLFPNEDPVGRRLPTEQLGLDELGSVDGITIVGIARDIKHQLYKEPRDTDVYIPYTQAPARMSGQAQFLVRTDASPAAVIPAISKQVQSVEKDLPLVGIRTVAEEMGDDFGEERSLAVLVGLFGALAVALASIGLYGTLSYAVGRRTKELGIRLALGAERRRVVAMVVAETLRMLVVGVAVGIPAALLGSRLISGLLFGVKPADPLAISGSVIVMLSTALIASYIPARRASRVDPAVALRCD